LALPVFRGSIREYGYKGRGIVTLSNGKNLALRVRPNNGGKRVPRPGDPVRCQIFASSDMGIIIVNWAFELDTPPHPFRNNIIKLR
jgi:hypothetical protein